MQTHVQHKFVSARQKMIADGKPAHGRIDSARKRNRKEVLTNYIKTSINIGHQHDRWVELKEALRVQTDAAMYYPHTVTNNHYHHFPRYKIHVSRGTTPPVL